MIKLYNTLKKKKQVFKPIKKKEVRLYTCGPTVHNKAHVGNLRAMVFYDLLRRYLEFRGYKVKQVVNITDVDDKTIKASQEQGVKLKDYTSKYAELFLKDLKELGIEKAEEYPKATDNINEMVDLVKKLLKKKYAYKAKDGIYFDISSFKNYGKLSGVDLSSLKAGGSGRVEDEYDKEDVSDFALWKFYTEDDGDVFWDVDIGKGRPGWHLECSAMSKKYLGLPFDIHAGGVDLVFPHHENEIAQSEAGYGKKMSNYWMHNEHLLINGKKMSKSKGNFYTLDDLKQKGHSVKEVRYALLSIHYRQKINLTDELLKQAKDNVKKINDFYISCYHDDSESGDIYELIKRSKKEFVKAMDDDLNISKALNVVFEFIKTANKFTPGQNAKKFIKEIDKVFSILEEQDIPKNVLELADKREEARKNKEWDKADELRDEINDLGFEIKDKPEGYLISKL